LDQRVVGDGRSVPNVLQQLVFGNQTISLLQKVDKYLESLLPQVALFTVAPDATVRRINLNIREAIALSVHRSTRLSRKRPVISEVFRFSFVTFYALFA
jgi:hypothetical protein